MQGPPVAPHVHAPALQALALLGSHGVQEPPSDPQSVVDGPEHAPPEQHPDGHDVESQTHVPPEQCVPVMHCVDVPHLHVPPVHMSASFGSHGTHVPALGPHSITDGDSTHTLLPQQPIGHDVALQTQAPLTHSSPLPQGAPVVPQVHTPLEQVSEWLSQLTHPPPAGPHAVIEGVVVHVAPEQHPVLHVAESHPVHTFAMHDPFEGQTWQAAPPEPQWFASTLSTHASPLQHPVQVDPSQMHLPPEQCCPVAHTGPPPHVQVPVIEHPSPTVTP